jgi:hypothetical protein
MKTTSFPLRILFAAFLLLPWAGVFAQQRPTGPQQVVLQVDGLTSATRDAVMKDLSTSADVELVYACVPAGILVFASRIGQNRVDLEQRSRAALTSRSATLRAHTLDQSQAQVEAACSQARNR